MNNCATCKHWTPPEDFYDEICTPLDQDTFEPMTMPFEVRMCQHPAKTFCERPVEANGFGLADASTYRATLYTGPEFGCIRHEAHG